MNTTGSTNQVRTHDTRFLAESVEFTKHTSFTDLGLWDDLFFWAKKKPVIKSTLFFFFGSTSKRVKKPI